MAEESVSIISSPDRKSEVHIRQGPNGFWSFTGYSEASDKGYVFLSPSYQSGLYESGEAAECEARVILPWLRDLRGTI